MEGVKTKSYEFLTGFTAGVLLTAGIGFIAMVLIPGESPCPTPNLEWLSKTI